MKDLTYILPDSIGKLIFTGDVLERMLIHRQISFFSREAGGQLFAEFKEETIHIVDLTHPNKKDRRSRFSFLPHRPTERVEIYKQFTERGIHFVGDWHTHPQKIPRPSNSDTESVFEIMNESKHSLHGILLVIVGLADLPEGIYVGFQTKDKLYQLSPDLSI